MTDFEPGLYDQLTDGLLSARLDRLGDPRLATDVQSVDPEGP